MSPAPQVTAEGQAATQPLVSIGLPVRNEARHVDAALKALRSQDHVNLEIIICDNASTDDTLAICREHAALDSRIRIEPAAENIGVTANFRRSFDLARGDYFMWASGHDLWTANLVSDCLAQLQANRSASLAYASADWIGPEGEPLDRYSGWTDTRGMGPVERFFTIFWGNMHPVLGLIRSEDLRASGPLPAVVGGDLVLLTHLALRGHFVHATQSRWSRRELRAESAYSQKAKRYVSRQFGVSDTWLRRTFPLLSLPLALSRAVWRSRLGPLDKALTLLALLPALALRYRVGRRTTPP